MLPEILAGVSVILSLASLAVAVSRKRKPSLASAVARGVAYGKAMGGDPEARLRHACAAVQKEDLGDNGKRDWPDSTIRFEVEALIETSK